MTDLERRALLGYRQAQEEATSDKKQAIGDDPDESTQKASGKRLS